MMKELVFLLEDQSMKAFLEVFLPRIIDTHNVAYRLIAHEGKSDLKKSIPRKIRNWNNPSARFIILHDQDSANCKVLKDQLSALCIGASHEYLIRIACKELEAWFLGDLAAVELAFQRKSNSLSKLQVKSKYRDPDKIGSPSKELKKLLGSYRKVSSAREIAGLIDVDRCVSKSFQVFVDGVIRLAC